MTDTRLFVGIDPGISGAVAMIRHHDGVLRVFDMPVQTFAKARKTTNAKALYELLAKFVPHYDTTIVIEKVWSGVYGSAIRKQGVASAFGFGRSAGIVLGVANSFPKAHVVEVFPAVWKGCLGLTSDKTESIVLARELFPANRLDFVKLKHEGRAEATLIAHSGRIKFTDWELENPIDDGFDDGYPDDDIAPAPVKRKLPANRKPKLEVEPLGALDIDFGGIDEQE